ncbi:MAG: dihydrodipicolinate synthase family protein [Pirellulales bacterium]
MSYIPDSVKTALQAGVCMPAMPLALDANRKFDERYQRAICRYYHAAGARGFAVGVHVTQFAIREPKHGLYRPVLELMREEFDRADQLLAKSIPAEAPMIRVGGIAGLTDQALSEAAILKELGYHAGLLSMIALKGESEERILDHCRQVAEVIPVFGFYLDGVVEGPRLTFDFWRQFCEIENVVAIKLAAFDRYKTIDVIRAVVESGRDDIALYTGNDDTIVMDLVTPHVFQVNGKPKERRICGGLLGHWAVWTTRATEMLERCHIVSDRGAVPEELIQTAIEVTDMNAAIFDSANGFVGSVAGINEVLYRQGLLPTNYCLDENNVLSPGQAAEIDRVTAAYPHLTDNAFVKAHLEEWLAD